VQGLEEINNDLIDMGAQIEISINKALTALKEGDAELALSVKSYSARVDELERTIERTCMQVLVSQQPVARDLRLISVALKLITDMRRISDQTWDIATIIVSTIENDFERKPELVEDMFKKTIAMVNQSVDAFVNRDRKMAMSIIEADDDVDDLFIAVRDELIDIINQDKKAGEQCIDYIMMAKYLERIADHAVNIAALIIYFVTGKHYNFKKAQIGEEDV